MIKYTQNCRSCNHNNLVQILNLGRQTIQGSFVYPSKPKPPVRKIDSKILICNPKTGGCGLIQNSFSVSPEILYSNYGYRSSVSNTMRNHLKLIVNNLLTFSKYYNFDITNVLDIGANDLFTLKQYPNDVERIGIDPCDIIRDVDKENITIINECFPSSKLINKKFDVITSIACFYDINDPVEFCKNIEKLLRPNGIWIVEFAYLPAVLENLAYDGMVWEHCCLYSLSSFENILNRTGLKLIKAFENDTNGGSLQVWVSKKDNNYFDNKENKEDILKIKIKEFDLALDDLNIYEEFAIKVLDHKYDLIKILQKIKRKDKKIHIYGMSTKLNTILNYCEIGPEIIDFAAERSPEKWSATTISGIPIISEEESRKMKPDVYLVGPYHFKKEILEREQKTIKNGTKFLFPLPKIELI